MTGTIDVAQAVLHQRGCSAQHDYQRWWNERRKQISKYLNQHFTA